MGMKSSEYREEYGSLWSELANKSCWMSQSKEDEARQLKNRHLLQVVAASMN